MANTIRDYSATAASNTVVDGADISEGCSPAGINDAIRGVMADLKDVSTGAVALESPAMDSLTVDTTGIVYSGGNVGIGTSPLAKFHVNNTNSAFYMGYGGNEDIYLQTTNGNVLFTNKGATTERMRIDSSGNVGIGTSSPDTTPSTKLHIREDDAVDYKSRAVVQATDQRLVAGSHYQFGVTAYSYLQATNDAETVPNNLLLNPDGGNVGIGTSSPATKLHVATVANTGLLVSSTDGTTLKGIVFNTNDNQFTVGTQTNHPVAFFSNNAERVRIDTSGNVGINTATTLGAKLFVSQGAAASPATSGNMTTGAVIGSSPAGEALNVGTDADGVWYNAAYANNAGVARIHRWLTGGSERMRIDASGNVLVASTSPNDMWRGLGQDGTHLGSSYCASQFGSNTNLYMSKPSGYTDATYIAFFAVGSGVGSITTTGSSVAYNTSSDYRLKTAVEYDWDATTRLKQLKPARFEWISDGDDAVPVDGFLAHEVQDIVPEAISGTKDGMRDEEYEVSAATGDIYTPAVEATFDEDGVELTAAVDEVIHSTDVEQPDELAEGQQWRETTAAVMGTRSVPDYQGIDQSKLVPLLVKTIQELEARITALEAN